jgi:hypothetical protein
MVTILLFLQNIDLMKDLLNKYEDRYKKLVKNKNIIDSSNKYQIEFRNKEIKILIFMFIMMLFRCTHHMGYT